MKWNRVKSGFRNSVLTRHLHGVEAPGFDVVAGADVHAHQPVEGHAEQLLFALAHELDDEQRHAVVGQRLPGCCRGHFVFPRKRRKEKKTTMKRRPLADRRCRSNAPLM